MHLLVTYRWLALLVIVLLNSCACQDGSKEPEVITTLVPGKTTSLTNDTDTDINHLPTECTDSFPALFEQLKQEIDKIFALKEASSISNIKKDVLCNQLLLNGMCLPYQKTLEKYCSLPLQNAMRTDVYYPLSYRTSYKEFCQKIQEFIDNTGPKKDSWMKFFTDPNMPFFDPNEEPALGAATLSIAKSLPFQQLKGMIGDYLPPKMAQMPIITDLKSIVPLLEHAYLLAEEKDTNFPFTKLISKMFCDDFDPNDSSDSSGTLKIRPAEFAEQFKAQIPWASVYLSDTLLKLPAKTQLKAVLPELFDFIYDFSGQATLGRLRARLTPVFLNLYVNSCLGQFFSYLRTIYNSKTRCPVYMRKSSADIMKKSVCFEKYELSGIPPMINPSTYVTTDIDDMAKAIHKSIEKDITSCESFINTYTCFNTDLSHLGFIHCPKQWYKMCSANSEPLYTELLPIQEKKRLYAKEIKHITGICCNNKLMCKTTKVLDNVFLDDPENDDDADDEEEETTTTKKPTRKPIPKVDPVGPKIITTTGAPEMGIMFT